MELSKQQIRACLLYDFKSGVNATESSRRIINAFGPGTISERSAREWFQRFRAEDYNLEDRPRTGRPSEVDDDRLRQMLDDNPRQTTRELAEILEVSHGTVENHLHAMGKVCKLAQWVPHTLTERNREQRAEAATSLLSYSQTTNWLSSIITGDEKWCLYINIKRRRSWVDRGSTPELQPKAGLHPNKVMLCVWWDCKGVILFELLPPNTTITADLYCQQLDRLAAKLAELRPNHGQIRFLHDNARPHTARLTREKLLDLGWELLPHPPYSPDLAPSDFHLFLSLSNALQNESKTFADNEDLSAWLANFFASKPEKFYSDGIMCLPDRWMNVIQSDGNYTVF